MFVLGAREQSEMNSQPSTRRLFCTNQEVCEMMRLKVTQLGEGLHPSETFVSVETKDGPEELIVDPHSLKNSTLPVGWPVGRQDPYLLVELPSPTARGYMRVWVRRDELIPGDSAHEAQ
jgi:hypothetical protein